MTVAKQQRSTRETFQNLPALPQVLLKLLDTISSDSADIPQLAQIIRQDSAITARILAVANSSLYNPLRHCNTVERALMSLGLETVRTLVLTAAFRQHFSHFDQLHYKFMQGYWRRSLSFAQSSQVLAKLTRYQPPAEAYLCGLLADVGQLCLLTEDASAFLSIYKPAADGNPDTDEMLVAREQNELGITHAEFGAALIENWQLDNFMSDAVRYHHHTVVDIRESHHLVKIVNLASDLSDPRGLGHAVLQKASELFGLNEDLVTELHFHIQADVAKICLALDLDQDHNKVRASLGARLEDIHQVQTITRSGQHRPAAGGTGTAENTVDPFAVSMLLGFGIERFLVFSWNADKQSLEAYKQSNPDIPVFDVSIPDSGSLLVQAFQNKKVMNASAQDMDGLSALDQQLMRYCRHTHLLLLPFRTSDAEGVVVAGVGRAALEEQQKKSEYWQLLLNTAAQSLSPAKESGDMELRIRETIHEVSNPLTVINNYLEVLRLRFADDSATNKELSILKDEIDRIGGILLRLRNPDTATDEKKTDINNVLQDLASIFRESMCAARGIAVKVNCDPALEPIHMNHAALRQVLTNLIKNAVEAMPKGGILTLDTRALVMVNGRPCAAVTVEDTGPGMPASVLDNLFEPTRSTKGNAHAGLGLSVVKRLTDTMKAEILCRSDATGTQFKLLFPITKERG